MKIALTTPVLVPGDAVSNDILGMYSVLKGEGHDVDIFAYHSTVSGVPVRSIDTIEKALEQPDDLFLYHFSVGWDRGLHLLKTLRCRKAIKYHNVTPPEYFAGVNEDYAAVCRAGRQMLQEIAATPTDLFLSDSTYNLEELVRGGAPRAKNFVVPPFHQIDRLLQADADLPALERLRDGHTNILMVGRLAPNKGHVALVEAFAMYHYEYNRLSRLFIVGKHDPRLKGYIDLVYGAIARAQLQNHVFFTEEVSDEHLKAFFLTAHAFAIASEHEGFCVPVVEAMAHHVPVTAYASTGLTETLSHAGIVWPERKPGLMAASLDEITRNPKTSMGLAKAGWERYKAHFDNEIIKTRFFDALRATWPALLNQ